MNYSSVIPYSIRWWINSGESKVIKLLFEVQEIEQKKHLADQTDDRQELGSYIFFTYFVV